MKSDKEKEKETLDLVKWITEEMDGELIAPEDEEPEDFPTLQFDKGLLDQNIIVKGIRYAGVREFKGKEVHDFDVIYSYPDSEDTLTLRTNHAYVKILAKLLNTNKKAMKLRICYDTDKKRYYISSWKTEKKEEPKTA